MNAIAPKGWCPSALRPMETGDGYLVRLRLPNGVLTFALAREIAALSRRFGNGLIDLSARGNLQLRGVRADRIDALRARLDELALLDPDADAEAVRNVMPSPLAGFDPSATLDTRPYVADLESRLTREPALHALPAKFGFAIDGGGLLPLADMDADVGFRAYATSLGPRFAVWLGGALAGTMAPDCLTDVAVATAGAFLAMRSGERRMKALVARMGVEAVARAAHLAPPFDAPPASEPPRAADMLGVHPSGAGFFVGAALLFGQMRGEQLERIAQCAEARGAVELRLTTLRALLAVGLEKASAQALCAELADNGFLVEGDDVRLFLAACSGKPACSSAFADVRAVALSLAPHLAPLDGTLHVSGCAKGCAHNAPARFTFVATRDGYDLVQNGRARDEPSLRGLTVEALASHLTRANAGARP